MRYSYKNHGAVYIFKNHKANRVKVGTTSNKIEERLSDINAKWLGRRVTCQICGTRLLSVKGKIPSHGGGLAHCEGGDALPLERDVSIAKAYLTVLNKRYDELTGSEKGGVARNINSLKRRIDIFEHRTSPTGIFYLNTVYYTDFSDKVELLAHKYLYKYLDQKAPIGEVFCCSVEVATEAVDKALDDLGLLSAAKREIEDYRASPEYGECPICGEHLSRKRVCIDCSIFYNS